MTVARPTDNGGGKEAGRIIYLDNAATTYPKPPQVFAEMQHFMEHVGGNPGRSGHRLSVEAGRIIYETREALARLFNASDSSRIILTCNCTEAINIALKGILRHGDHVVATSMEHNSVMRPLRQLVQLGVIDLSVVSCESDGSLNPATIRAVLHDNTRLIAISHASNVTGTILPIEEVTRIAHQHGALVLVDAAQTAGCLPIDLTNSDIDLLAFSGHKGLFGPQGTGGLFIRDGIEEQMQPLKCGGTGSRSEREYQPEFLPDKFESGTPNTVGIAGLRAGVQFVLNIGVSQIRKKELELTE
ncbi:MAG TPA: aminotransferase class V-fold PLP-dependent enzyme, partial [Armatimonadetes bacterium]|nr:aminotransferase class V-fold PLP-dependent enzyme [Armatimonadota bacterium]